MYLLFCLFWKCLVVYLYRFWKSSPHGDKEPVLFMFTGCVKCCTFLFIDVTVGRFVLLFVLRFRFCFQMLKYIKKGYYVLEFVIGLENRDKMTKELSLIILFLVLFCMIIFFLHGILIPLSLLKQGYFV